MAIVKICPRNTTNQPWKNARAMSLGGAFGDRYDHHHRAYFERDRRQHKCTEFVVGRRELSRSYSLQWRTEEVGRCYMGQSLKYHCNLRIIQLNYIFTLQFALNVKINARKARI